MELLSTTNTPTSNSDGDDLSRPLCLGYDPGFHPDPAALALVSMERRPVPGKFDPRKYVPEQRTPLGFVTPGHYGAPILETHYNLHFMQVMHSLPYPDQVRYIAELLREPRFHHRPVTIRIDITGVGQSPYESLQRELRLHPESKHIRCIPVRFVSGEKYVYGKHPESLGKGALVAILLQRLQWRLVHASPDIMDLTALQSELEVFNREMDESTGNTQFGAASGKHDDRIISLGLAIISDPLSMVVQYSQRLY